MDVDPVSVAVGELDPEAVLLLDWVELGDADRLLVGVCPLLPLMETVPLGDSEWPTDADGDADGDQDDEDEDEGEVRVDGVGDRLPLPVADALGPAVDVTLEDNDGVPVAVTDSVWPWVLDGETLAEGDPVALPLPVADSVCPVDFDCVGDWDWVPEGEGEAVPAEVTLEDGETVGVEVPDTEVVPDSLGPRE